MDGHGGGRLEGHSYVRVDVQRLGPLQRAVLRAAYGNRETVEAGSLDALRVSLDGERWRTGLRAPVSSSRVGWTFIGPCYAMGNVWGATPESAGRPVRWVTARRRFRT